MDETRRKPKRGLIFKTWERCKTLGRAGKSSSKPRLTHGPSLAKKSKSWSGPLPSLLKEVDAPPPRLHGSLKQLRAAVPEGCFSVYVGPEKQRFVVRTECANHPLFQMLLEEAESEFGYSSGGPIELPCDVAVFCRVLMEMDSADDDGGRVGGLGAKRRVGCGVNQGYGGYRLLSPSRMITINQF